MSTKKYYPKKYYSGLSKTQKQKRYKEIHKYGSMSWKNPKAYVGFKTDTGAKTKKSNYTRKFQSMFPKAKSLKQKSEATGVPLSEIKGSYDRGLAAWRTGHRPGATAQQWGYARVHSFLTCGKTHYSTDSDLVRKAKSKSSSASKWWKKMKC
jgi:hypothetical protein